MDEEQIPIPKKATPVKGEVLLSFIDQSIIDLLGVGGISLKSLSLSNLSVNLITGAIERRSLTFLPCLACRLSSETLFEKGLGSKEEKGIILEGEWELKESGKRVKLIETRIAEDVVYFVDTGHLRPDNSEISQEIEAKAKITLIKVLEGLKEHISCNYAKYFVNNTFIIEEDHFPNKEVIPKIRSELYEYINQNIKKEVEPKTQVQAYLDNFGFRPFYGPAIHKLPNYNAEIDRYDWDDLYINVEQTKKELSIL